MLELMEFTKELAKTMEEKLGSNFEVTEMETKKINMGKMVALMIKDYTSAQLVSPTFYVEPLYEVYRDEEEDIDTIADMIVTKYFEEVENNGVLEGLNDLCGLEWEAVKDRVTMQIVSYEKNAELLRDLPYIPFLDCVIVFSILVDQNDEHIRSIRITNSLAHNWNVELMDIFEAAKINTPQLYPIVFKKLSEVIFELMDVEEFEEAIKLPEEDLYVLSNKSNINGFTAIAYDGALDRASKVLQDNYYIIPSSIHEAILVPESYGLSEEELRQMVADVNGTVVAEEDRLSDEVYFYDRQKKQIVITKKGCEVNV